MSAKVKKLTPPLKWHGGKNYLASKIIDLMPSRCKSQRWREKWEAKTDCGLTVLHTEEHGSSLIAICQDDRGLLYPRYIKDLILKPRPRTYRPWTPEEVPVGRVVEYEGANRLIASSDDVVVTLGGTSSSVTFENLFRHAKLVNADGSLGPCGVEEGV